MFYKIIDSGQFYHNESVQVNQNEIVKYRFEVLIKCERNSSTCVKNILLRRVIQRRRNMLGIVCIRTYGLGEPNL